MDQLNKWWHNAIGYQIFIKSFYDSNDDGIGDLNGVTLKLDYLCDLGIDFIWLCPFFDSPMDDNGYDVRDYYNVASVFGNMNDLKTLIDEAKKRDIKIIADLVLNHTSDEHEWFVKAKMGDEYYKDFYIIEKSDKPPSNWQSFFGGSTWERFDDSSYYLKIFSKKMPDLNWENENLRKAIYKISADLLELGISGFRVDAVSHLAKDRTYPNVKKNDYTRFTNLPHLFDYLDEFNKEVLSKHNVFTVGEVGGTASISQAKKFMNVFSMVFNFDHLWHNNLHLANNISEIKTDVFLLRNAFMKWQYGLRNVGMQPIYIANHDGYRAINCYGDENFNYESATMMATLYYLQKGVPFIYQGEEIGMTNYPFNKLEQLNDVQTIGRLVNKTDKPFRLYYSSRDNNRTPMQWNSTKYGGFSTHKPWLDINSNYVNINVENQLEGSSVLNYYKTLIKIKKSDDILINGDIEFIDIKNSDIISYMRITKAKTYLIICNMRNYQVKFDYKFININILLSNYSRELYCNLLEPFETIVMEIKK